MKRFLLAAAVILTAGAATLPMLGNSQTTSTPTYSNCGSLGGICLPPNFQPGDELYIGWRRGGLTPTPTPTPATLSVRMFDGPTGKPFPGQATYLNTDALLGKVLFPAPAAGTPVGQGWWNVPVDTMPVHPQSGAWLTSMAATAPIHPDFGAASYGSGIPFMFVPAAQKLVPVAIGAYATESDVNAAGYPIPDSPFVEAASDQHLIVVTDAMVAWEFYGFALSGGTYTAKQVTRWDLSKDAARTAGLTSADAAGLSLLAGLVRYDEANSGVINHAFRFTVRPSSKGWIAPASHASSASLISGTNNPPAQPPMGARWVLDQAVDVTVLPGTTTPTTPKVRAILTAMKKYGCIAADNGTTGYVQGTPDSRWNDDENAQLKKFTFGMGHFADTGAPIVPMN